MRKVDGKSFLGISSVDSGLWLYGVCPDSVVLYTCETLHSKKLKIFLNFLQSLCVAM